VDLTVSPTKSVTLDEVEVVEDDQVGFSLYLMYMTAISISSVLDLILVNDNIDDIIKSTAVWVIISQFKLIKLFIMPHLHQTMFKMLTFCKQLH